LGDLLEFSDSDLRVGDIMTRRIVSAQPAEPLLAVAMRMSQENVSCVVVVSGREVVGMVTERDLLKRVAAGQRDFARMTIAEVMSSPAISVEADTPVLEASDLIESRGIKRLPVLDAGRLVGVVTQTDIIRGLISLSPLREISAFMSREVATISSAATVAEAAQVMASRNVSCIVALHRGEATGVLTEKDILRRVVTLGKDPTHWLVADVMTMPIQTAPPTHSVMSVSRMMDEMHVHRLVVGTADDVQGIISQTDILMAVRSKLEEVRNERLRHKSELSRLADSIAENLVAIRDLAGDPPCDADFAGPTVTDLIRECQANLQKLSGLF